MVFWTGARSSLLAWLGAASLVHHNGPAVITDTFKPIVLDVGCGRGFSTFDLSRQMPSAGLVLGLDPDANVLRVAQKILKNDPKVILLHSSVEDFARVCRQGSIHYIRMHYCHSHRSFPYPDELRDCIDHILSPEGILEIQDYQRYFLYTELAEDPEVHPDFDWTQVKNVFSDYRCLSVEYPTLSSQRMLFRKIPVRPSV